MILRAAALVLLACLSRAEESPEARVRTLYDAGRWEEALQAAQAAPVSPDTTLLHGLALAQLNRLEDAARSLDRGRRLFPADKRFPLELAGVAYRRKQRLPAIRHLHRALRLDPDDSYAAEFLATLYFLEGNLAAAVKYWNRAGKPLIQEVRFVPVPDLDPVLRERTVEVSGGQILTARRLLATQESLDRLNVFGTYRFDLAPARDQRFDLTLRSTTLSQPITGWPGRLLPFARSLPYQAINIDRFNIGGGARNVESLWRWDAEKRRVDILFESPIGRRPDRRYRLRFDTRDENWNVRGTSLTDLRLRKFDVAGDLQFALSHRLQWTTGLRVTQRRFGNHDPARGVQGGWTFEQRNRFDYLVAFQPENRIRVDAAAQIRTGRFTSSRYAAVESEVRALWQPPSQGGKLSASVNFRAGGVLGEIPFDELFILGMERDNNLWMRGHPGTRRGRKGNAPLGQDYVLLNMDVRRTLFQFAFIRLDAGPFLDTGAVQGTFGSQGWLYDTGMQLNVRTFGRTTWSIVYGRDLRDGRGTFYTSVSR